jgi:hypothetical protein
MSSEKTQVVIGALVVIQELVQELMVLIHSKGETKYIEDLLHPAKKSLKDLKEQVRSADDS